MMGKIEESRGIAYSTVYQCVQQLQESGLLLKVADQSRNRVCRTDEVLEVIEVPLGQMDKIDKQDQI